MRRYLFIALVIGAIGALTTALLFEFGLLGRFADKLAVYYANAGLLEEGARPHRVLHALAFTVTSFVTAWAVLDIPRPLHKAIVVLGTALVVLSLSPTFVLFRGFFEPFSSLCALGVAASLAWIYSLTEHGSRKLRLQRYLGGRVSEAAWAALLGEAPPPFFRGANLPVTALVVRVFNLSRLQAELSPAVLIEITNLFLRNSGEFLASRGGYLDESSPDAVRVYFGLLRPGSDHAADACAAALELRQRLDNLNQLLESRYFQRLDYGMALGTDAMTVGIFRSEGSPRLGAAGELVEFTRRLAGANREYGSSILLGASTHALVRDTFAARPMELVYDAAKDLMTEAYELVARLDDLTPEDDQALKDFWQAIIYYREGRAEEALFLFSRLRAAAPQDRPLQFFIDRAQSRLVASGSSPEEEIYLRHGHARVLQSL
jgi:class 3 adenylate cyclase